MNENIIIRNATDKDFKTIQNFNSKLIKKEHDEYTTTFLENYATTDKGIEYFKARIKFGIALIAQIRKEDQNIPVGYLLGSVTEPQEWRNITGKFSEIENMWVEEKERSAGIGKLLIREFQTKAKGLGAARMKVSATAQNNKAIKFYEREGFEPFALILEKDL